MRLPLKLSEIAREHLQELYDSTGISRDELPYTPEYDGLCQGFQDRTFNNADPEQVFGALLKYVRTSRCPNKLALSTTLTPEQAKQLKGLLPRHARGGKLLPYSDEYKAALKEFNQHAGTTLDEKAFWQAILAMQSSRRRPPVRAKVAQPAADEPDEEEGE
jgi:hypothetical protein